MKKAVEMTLAAIQIQNPSIEPAPETSVPNLIEDATSSEINLDNSLSNSFHSESEYVKFSKKHSDDCILTHDGNIGCMTHQNVDGIITIKLFDKMKKM